MSAGNPWLRAQRKGELVDLAEAVGLKKYVLFCFSAVLDEFEPSFVSSVCASSASSR
jgi:hypothetical protein